MSLNGRRNEKNKVRSSNLEAMYKYLHILENDLYFDLYIKKQLHTLHYFYAFLHIHTEHYRHRKNEVTLSLRGTDHKQKKQPLL